MKKNIYQSVLAFICLACVFLMGGESEDLTAQLVWTISFFCGAMVSGYLLNKSIEKEDKK